MYRLKEPVRAHVKHGKFFTLVTIKYKMLPLVPHPLNIQLCTLITLHVSVFILLITSRVMVLCLGLK